MRGIEGETPTQSDAHDESHSGADSSAPFERIGPGLDETGRRHLGGFGVAGAKIYNFGFDAQNPRYDNDSPTHKERSNESDIPRTSIAQSPAAR